MSKRWLGWHDELWWGIHNFVAHPASQIFYMAGWFVPGFQEIGDWFTTRQYRTTKQKADMVEMERKDHCHNCPFKDGIPTLAVEKSLVVMESNEEGAWMFKSAPSLPM